MEFEIKNTCKEVEFKDICIGELFYYDGEVYVKYETFNQCRESYTKAVSLVVGKDTWFQHDLLVVPVKSCSVTLCKEDD